MIIKDYRLKDENNCVAIVLAVIGAIIAVAAVAALVVKFLMLNERKYCDGYHCECDDSDDDDFCDDDDDFEDDDEEDIKI